MVRFTLILQEGRSIHIRPHGRWRRTLRRPTPIPSRTVLQSLHLTRWSKEDFSFQGWLLKGQEGPFFRFEPGWTWTSGQSQTKPTTLRRHGDDARALDAIALASHLFHCGATRRCRNSSGGGEAAQRAGACAPRRPKRGKVRSGTEKQGHQPRAFGRFPRDVGGDKDVQPRRS